MMLLQCFKHFTISSIDFMLMSQKIRWKKYIKNEVTIKENNIYSVFICF
jgi:hypothetical protein